MTLRVNSIVNLRFTREIRKHQLRTRYWLSSFNNVNHLSLYWWVFSTIFFFFNFVAWVRIRFYRFINYWTLRKSNWIIFIWIIKIRGEIYCLRIIMGFYKVRIWTFITTIHTFCIFDILVILSKMFEMLIFEIHELRGRVCWTITILLFGLNLQIDWNSIGLNIDSINFGSKFLNFSFSEIFRRLIFLIFIQYFRRTKSSTLSR